MHIPKTAGTSFRSVVESIINKKKVFPTKKHLKKHNGYVKLEQLDDYRSEIKESIFFSGHYNLWWIKAHHPNFSVISFLRDPIERVISHLKHVKAINSELNNLTLTEIFNHEKFHYSQFNNLQTRYFMNGPNSLPLNYGNLINAKKNLIKCDFIGFTEEFDKSMENFSKYLDIQMQEEVVENITRLKEVEIPDSLMVDIYKANLFDIELYHYAYHNKKKWEPGK